MTDMRNNTSNAFEQIPFRMHPRVFSALGADLVTNDVVAVIELVKNSYDAFAHNVWLRFGESESGDTFLEITDDGEGMTRDILENVWCIIATPYKELNPHVGRGSKKRRVVGEKGLGRLSVARLGDQLTMLTQAQNNPCWEVDVDWAGVAEGDDLSSSYARCRNYEGHSPFNGSGTRLLIRGLTGLWDENRILDLEENLARLISPFSAAGEFNIFLSGFDETGSESVRIASPEFLAKPKYRIRGNVDGKGNISAAYLFSPISQGSPRKNNFTLSWERIYDQIQDRTQFHYASDRSHCGPFSFEIRAWDIAPDDTREIAEHFDLQKNLIRRAIRAHKGISVYRDGVLVLPKSDNTRDWLGLDLRRISKVGTRLSTSQIVGYVSISAEDNSKIEDTSDRERLASRREVAEFEEILKAVVALLENERDEDRIKPGREKPMENLFEGLSAASLIDEVVTLANEGADASETLPLLHAFQGSLESNRQTIQERFVYYSRLATVGTIAHMLVHEIRTRTTAFGSFIDAVKDRFSPFKDVKFEKVFHIADGAVDALERLADTFTPLASRSFRRRRRRSILEERIHECITLHMGEISRKNVKYNIPATQTEVAVDPGELDAIVLNIITNAVHWMGEVSKENRQLKFKIIPAKSGKRVTVWVHDTGPGLDKDYVDRIFWPGVTRKPGGIGMGLTVASELVAAYGGRMRVKQPGKLSGASFAFDLPMTKQG